jgi:hypothetical protein
MAFEKTKEELEEEQRLLSERYPELVGETPDPTQGSRDYLKRLLGSAIKPDSPLGAATEGLRNAGLPQEPKEQFEMSPDTKKYGYDLFGIKGIAGDTEQEIPFAPNQEPISDPTVDTSPEDNIEPAIQKPVQNRSSSIPTAITSKGRQPSSVIPPEAEEEAPEASQDNTKLVEAMQRNQQNAKLAESMARTRDAIIGAGAGRRFETDYGMYKDLQEEASSPIQKIKIIQELDNAQAKNDPNSQLSKLIRKSLSELGVSMEGMDKVSYAQIEKLYPSVANAMTTKLAAEARKEEAILTRQIKAEGRADKEEARREASYEKTRAVINNKIGKLQESKTSPFNGYNQAKQTTQMLDNAIDAWDQSDNNAKIKNSVAFMQYAKLAQGDDSVVRSSDMQALAGGLNYSSPYALLNKFAAKAEGSSFTKDELIEMKKVIETVRKVKKEQLQQRLDPIKLDAERGGYDLDQSISPDIMEEIYSPEPLSIADKAKRRQELLKKQGK